MTELKKQVVIRTIEHHQDCFHGNQKAQPQLSIALNAIISLTGHFQKYFQPSMTIADKTPCNKNEIDNRASNTKVHRILSPFSRSSFL